MPDTLDLQLEDSDVTDALGGALARALPPAVSGVLYLYGELGAGKTTCVRSLLRTLGVTGAIRSPTYTLVEIYPLSRRTCIHIDLYRLQGAPEVDELGLRDYLRVDALLLVEWPERGQGVLPPADLELTLRYAANGRAARILARTAQGRNWLSNLSLDPSLTSYVVNLT